jgi:predicted PurR-regulated permease PerM
MMIETTKDLFWLLLSLSIVLFTLFVCWGMYYMIMAIKDLRETIKSLKRKLDLLEEFLITVKEKITDTSQYLKTIIETVIKLTGWFAQQKEPRQNKKNKKSELE